MQEVATPDISKLQHHTFQGGLEYNQKRHPYHKVVRCECIISLIYNLYYAT